tara:strand:- start:48 stop:845 length:798 start_codon:yes stop_codon:yes gene_type:complete
MGKIIVGVLVIGVISFFTFRGGDKEIVDKEEETKERKTASLVKPKTKETAIEKEKKEEEKEKAPKLSKEKVAEIKELIQKGKDEVIASIKNGKDSNNSMTKEEVLQKFNEIPEDLESYNLSEDKDYFVSKKWRAISKKKFKKEMGEKSFEKMGMVFFKPSDGIEAEDALKVQEDHPVTYNKESKMFGILSGSIKIKLNPNNEDTLNKVLKGNNLKVLYKAAHINFYSVAPESKDSALNVSYEALKKDENVKLAELEIIETVPSSK